MINVEKIKPTGIFTNYIYKAIPLAFDESMSYYECLCGLLSYLKNTVIPALNNNANAIIEVQNLMTELQNYVDNYFNNLDVQEEINNKLDEMVEEGTLQEIITDYLNSKAIFGFDTIQDLKESTNLINGSYAQTLGYNSKNDGGIGLYKIREITNADVVNEATIIALNDENLIAELISTDVNLMNFGCYGDGIHDDTTNLNKALTYANTNNLNVTSPDDKIYLLSDDIEIGNVNLFLSNSTFKTDYGIKITATRKELNFPQIIAINGLSNNNGIEMFECYTNKVYVPYIENFTNGLILTASANGCCYNNITIQEIRNCLSSLKLLHTNTGWVNENIFIGGRLWNDTTFTTAHGSDIKIIYIQGSETHSSNNNRFIAQCVEGTEGTANGVKLKIDHAQVCVFDNLRYEGSNAKVDVTNSIRIILNNGFNLNGVSYVNDLPTVYVNGVNNKIVNGGANGGIYMDIQMNSNSYPAIQVKRTDGTVAHKITPQALFICDNSGNDAYRYNSGGIDVKYNDTFYRIIGGYHQYTLIPNCDGTNRCFVIGSGTNVNNAVFLWYNDGHLYGKIGAPSTASDGTIIL